MNSLIIEIGFYENKSNQTKSNKYKSNGGHQNNVFSVSYYYTRLV